MSRCPPGLLLSALVYSCVTVSAPSLALAAGESSPRSFLVFAATSCDENGRCYETGDPERFGRGLPDGDIGPPRGFERRAPPRGFSEDREDRGDEDRGVEDREPPPHGDYRRGPPAREDFDTGPPPHRDFQEDRGRDPGERDDRDDD